MMTQIQIFKSKDYGKVRGYVDSNGTVFINVTDIAYGLGFVNKKGKIRLNKINTLLKSFKYRYEVNEEDYLPENIFYRLAMKADNEAANNFQEYLSNEVIPQIRKTGNYISAPVNAVQAVPSPVNEVRKDNINTRKSFTSVVQLFVFYARNQGDTRPEEKLYKKFTILANQCAGIPNGGRATATPKQLLICQQAENLMGNILLKGMDADRNFASIESAVILEVNQFVKYIAPTLPLLN